ncbi:MAG: hypothetical protein VX223_00580 [Myxococcota bacterium]|nr:hypothetical protein [Myxococcota bacterium]
MLVENVVGSALFAGVVASAVTVAIERFGGRIGGLLGTLPTTIVPASVGLWLQTANVDAFQAAMDSTPAGMLVNALFLLCWRVVPPWLPQFSLKLMLCIMSISTLGFWILLAWPTVLLGESFPLGETFVFGVVSMALLLSLGVAATRKQLPTPKGQRAVSWFVLGCRGVFAATAIGVAVWTAEVIGPVAAGIAAVFPAIFFTSMASLWLAQGHAVPAGAVGPMMLGSSSVGAYALFAHVLFPALGPWVGAVTCWFAAVVTTTVPAWWWLEKRAV